MNISYSLKSNAGFSLIEVLIAFLIIMVGILGFAKSQAVALSNTNVSNVRSNAALQAASLAAAMHANTAFWAKGLAPASMTINNATLSNAALNALTTDCTTLPCTPNQLAAFDSREWGKLVRAQFTNGQGMVVCSTVMTAPITCTISVSWQEKNVALNAATGSGTSTQTYSLVVIP